MRVLSLRDAATYLGCSVRWVELLLQQEFLSSVCQDELVVYAEKSSAIHNTRLQSELLHYYGLG